MVGRRVCESVKEWSMCEFCAQDVKNMYTRVLTDTLAHKRSARANGKDLNE